MYNYLLQKVFAFTTFFVFGISAIAQPTIGVGFWLEPGERSLLVPCDTAGVANGAAGANVTWNYTGLTANAGLYSPMTQFYWEGVDLATAPFAHQYPTADGGYLQGDSTFSYIKNNNGALEWIGFVAEAQGANVRSFYTDGEAWVTVPFTFQDMGSDNFSGTDSVLTPVAGYFGFHFQGSLSWEADGYGTLQLPNATYNNVLRIRLQRTRNTASPGSGITVENDNYLYFSPSYEYIILDIENIVTRNPAPMGPQKTRRVFYATAPPMNSGVLPNRSFGLEDLKTVDFIHVYPNPVSDILNISLATNAPIEIDVKMTDMAGQVVYSQAFNSSTGTAKSISIPVSELPSGVYTVTATANGEVTTVKVTVK